VNADLACIIHKCCRALAGSFVRNKSLVGRPYAWLRSPSSEWPLRGHAVRCNQSPCAIITAIYEWPGPGYWTGIHFMAFAL